MSDNPFYEHFQNEIEKREQLAKEQKRKRDEEEARRLKIKEAKDAHASIVTDVLEQLQSTAYPHYKVFHPISDNVIWGIGYESERSSKWFTTKEQISVVNVILKFDSNYIPIHFVCFRQIGYQKREIKAELNRQALINALRELHSITHKMKIMQQYDEIVRSAMKQWSVQWKLNHPNETHTLHINSPDHNLDKYMEILGASEYIGNWVVYYTVFFDTFDDGRSEYDQVILQIRLRLGVDNEPICFEQVLGGKVICETDLTYEGLYEGIKEKNSYIKQTNTPSKKQSWLERLLGTNK